MNSVFTRLSRTRLKILINHHQTMSLSHTYSGYDLANYRSLISIKGADASVYLQNLITNDIRSLNSTDKRSLYAMMLNNRGRIMYDVLVYCLNTGESSSKSAEYLVELDSRFVNEALRLFKVFKLKKKIEVNHVDSEYKLYSIINKNEDQSDLEVNEDAKTDLICVKDPRYSPLGYRAILKSNTNEPVKQKISSYVQNLVEDAEFKNYKKFMYRNGIAENNDDIKEGSSIPLEYNIVFLNGVSFSKGCYLGQELIAKTHHTGVIRKRIMPFKILNRESDSSFKQENTILNTKTGQVAGKLRNVIDDDGIAMLRLSNIDKHNLVLLDNNQKHVKIEPIVPKYWPLDDPSLSELKDFEKN